MPRKPKPKAAVGRPRKPSVERKRHVLSIRVQDALRDDLERRSVANSRSLSDEVVYRLNSALSQESALGGPELRATVLLMIARFGGTGQQEADLALGLGTSPAKWLKDSRCYDSALLSLFEALIVRRPDRSEESERAFFEAFKSRILSRWADEKAEATS